MKKVVIILLSTVIFSCHSQEKDKNNLTNNPKPMNIEIPINPKTMEAYTNEEFSQKDIEHYKKCKSDGDGYCEYVRYDGAKVIENDDDMVLFYRDIIPNGSLFKINKWYHANKCLWYKFETFTNNDSFIKGIRYEYNEQGKLIKVEDFDKPFKFTWEQVKKYIEQDLKLDLIKDKVGVGNNLESNYNIPTWGIDYIGKYKNNLKGGIIRITLSGNTGELLHVEVQQGKGGEGTTVDILYDINDEKKKTSAIYKTYEGKNYTESEWKVFEQQQYNEHLRKTGRADLIKPTENSSMEGQRKHSFLADEDDVKPIKKKGLWG